MRRRVSGRLIKAARAAIFPPIGCTSFFPSKPLGCYGDGGALFTQDGKLAQAMREIRSHGEPQRYHHTRIGVGGRMDTLQCAVVLAKLERFDWEIEKRREAGARYDELLRACGPSIRLLKVHEDRTSVYAQYTVLAKDREKLQAGLNAAGIPTAIHYPVPVHRQPAYEQYGVGRRLPVAEAVAAQVISLPMYADITPELQREIAAAVGRHSA